MDNDFLKNLDLSQVREIVESMYPKECARGSYLIREGEAGQAVNNFEQIYICIKALDY